MTDLKDKIKYEHNGIKFPCEMLCSDHEDVVKRRCFVYAYIDGDEQPFQVLCKDFGNTCYSHVEPLPKPTWREALQEKLKDHPEHFELVCERTPDENLDKEFTQWAEWCLYDPEYPNRSFSFDWNSSPEGFCFWNVLNGYFNSYRDDLPTLPKEKKKRLRTISEIWGKTLVHEDGRALIVNRLDDNGMMVFPTYPPMDVAHFFNDGFKVNMQGELDYDGAESLEVEQ